MPPHATRVSGAPKAAACPTQTAAEAIGRLAPGMQLFGLTKGQFSLIDLLLAVLDQTGPARVTVQSWTVGSTELDAVRARIDEGDLLDFMLVLDRSFPQRQPKFFGMAMRILGPDMIRLTRSHAKCVTVRNKNWAVLIHGSMNFNRNRRFEHFGVIVDDAACAHVEAHVEAMKMETPAGTRPTEKQIDAFLVDSLGGGMSADYGTDISDGMAPDGRLLEKLMGG